MSAERAAQAIAAAYADPESIEWPRSEVEFWDTPIGIIVIHPQFQRERRPLLGSQEGTADRSAPPWAQPLERGKRAPR